MYKNNQGHLTVFCIVFVWLRGPPSPVRIMTQVSWFMYENRLGPSGGTYLLSEFCALLCCSLSQWQTQNHELFSMTSIGLLWDHECSFKKNIIPLCISYFACWHLIYYDVVRLDNPVFCPDRYITQWSPSRVLFFIKLIKYWLSVKATAPFSNNNALKPFSPSWSLWKIIYIKS